MTKDGMRAEVLARRRAMTATEREGSAEALAAHVLAQPIVSRASRIAAYVSMPSEPGTGPLLAGLLGQGIEVLAPISLDDHTLDWVSYSPDVPQTTTALGISEPIGERLGPDALATVDLVIVPALAVDITGHRLGRGAGYYDRALSAASAPVCALLFAGEIVDAVAYEPHDVPVQMVITPTGVFRVP